MEYCFEAPPAVGTIHERLGNSYVLESIEVYRRKDGKDSFILVWRGHCADCGAPFAASGGMVATSLQRRCDPHKKAFKPATEEARLAMRANATKAREVMKANAKRRRSEKRAAKARAAKLEADLKRLGL